ncbi:MAG: STAS/SEC14 domain-containing protein [Deltaproteobacteria bacterium]|nr:STAS/SEC14 domain-containing protein [Deltaproteobacteria bacterium]
MLEMMDIGIEKAVAYRWGGKITEDEMTLALSALKEKIDTFGEVFIYQEIESFGGVEFDAIVEKFKFLFNVGISNIPRIAVVTDKKWMHKIIDLEGKLFKKIDMKSFSMDDKNEAIEFLKNV